MKPYDEFLRAKVRLAETWGFDIDDAEVHPMLKPHQRALLDEQAMSAVERAVG